MIPVVTPASVVLAMHAPYAASRRKVKA
jgi:hypothetical protein